MGVIAKGILRGCQGLFTPVSLRYPLSVFNKNSTLKERKVANRVFAIRSVQWLGWVFETQERKKERKFFGFIPTNKHQVCLNFSKPTKQTVHLIKKYQEIRIPPVKASRNTSDSTYVVIQKRILQISVCLWKRDTERETEEKEKEREKASASER